MQQQINNIFERGTLYCIGIGILAFWLGNLIPLLGKTMMGLILGISLRGVFFNEQSKKGITFCAKTLHPPLWGVFNIHVLKSVF